MFARLRGQIEELEEHDFQNFEKTEHRSSKEKAENRTEIAQQLDRRVDELFLHALPYGGSVIQLKEKPLLSQSYKDTRYTRNATQNSLLTLKRPVAAESGIVSH